MLWALSMMDGASKSPDVVKRLWAGSRYSAKIFLTILVAILVLVVYAMAITGAIDVSWLPEAIYIALVLTAVNLPMNLLFLSVAVLIVCAAYGKRVGRVPPGFRSLLGYLLAIAALVAYASAWIDILFILRHSFQDEVREREMDVIIATGLIFASILVLLFVVDVLRPILRVVVAGAAALMSPIIWTLSGVPTGDDPALSGHLLILWITFAAAALVAEVAVLLLTHRWYKRVYVLEETSVSTSGQT